MPTGQKPITHRGQHCSCGVPERPNGKVCGIPPTSLGPLAAALPSHNRSFRFSPVIAPYPARPRQATGAQHRAVNATGWPGLLITASRRCYLSYHLVTDIERDIDRVGSRFQHTGSVQQMAALSRAAVARPAMAAQGPRVAASGMNLRGGDRRESLNSYYCLRLETRQIPLLDIHMLH